MTVSCWKRVCVSYLYKYIFCTYADVLHIFYVYLTDDSSLTLSLSLPLSGALGGSCVGAIGWKAHFIEYFTHLWQRETPERHNWAYRAHEMLHSSSPVPPFSLLFSSLPNHLVSLLLSSSEVKLRGEHWWLTPSKEREKRLLASYTGWRYHMGLRKDTSFKMKAWTGKKGRKKNWQYEASRVGWEQHWCHIPLKL